MAQEQAEAPGAGFGASAATALVALGANAPFGRSMPVETLRQALARLDEETGADIRASRMWRTPAVPAGSGPDFVNAAAALSWSGRPEELLSILHAVEAEFGRVRRDRWGPRTLDLDLLGVGERVLPDRATFEAWAKLPADRQGREAPERLILPHPRMHERAFVLVPLAEVAPDWRHPVLGRSVAMMVEALAAPARAGLAPM
ncbi:MAG: 2-amino-4-hydroxy-6-hydroxymethyldihydropteridine diphosphokinase [Rhodosalinus sp.]|uniref:2-amino-4-hydroxy-6- hydroxymethyldihydropteridine diphosphokinase n=1 Tax=Rhodosalinus sp. TaxID=2047741 RepID=UPI0039786F64